MADGRVKIDTKFDLKGLPGEMKKLGGALKTGIAGAAKVAGIGLAAVAAAIGAVSVAAKKFAETTDRIDKMSQAIGMSRQAFQEWDYVLGQNGASIESLKTAMRTLTSEGGESANALESLGISLSDNAGKLKSQEQLFNEAVIKLQGMQNGTEKATLAQKLFGRSSQELMPLLNQTAESTDALRQKAHELGAVLSDEAVTSGVAFKDAMDDLKKAGGGLMNNAIAPMIPIFTDLAKEITNVATSGKTMDVIKEVLENVIKNAKAALAALKPIVLVIVDIIKWFTQWLAEFDVLNKVVKVMTTIIGAAFSFIKKAIGTVWVAWAHLVTFFLTAIHRIGGFFKSLGSDIDVAFSVGFNGAKIAMISMYAYLTQKLLGGVRTFLDILGKLPFVGEQFRAASAAVGRVSDAVEEGADAAKQASAEKIAAAKADRDATKAAVDANIAAVREEGRVRVEEARRVAEAIEEFEFKASEDGSGRKSPAGKAVEEDVEKAEEVITEGVYDLGRLWWKEYARGLINNILTGIGATKKAMQQITGVLRGSFGAISNVVRTGVSIISKLARFDPKDMLDSLKEILKRVSQFFLQDLGAMPAIIQSGALMIREFTQGIKNSMGIIIETAYNLVNTIATTIRRNAWEIASVAMGLLSAFVLAIINNLPELVIAAIGLVVAFALAIAENLPAIVSAFIAVIPELVIALIKATPAVVAAAFALAFQLVNGIIQGIWEFAKNIWSGIKQVFVNMWNAILGFFGIRSPSTEGISLGANIIKGIMNGIIGFGAGLWNAVKGVFAGFWDSLKSFFSGVWGWVKDSAKGILDGVKGVAVSAWEGVKGAASAVGGAVAGAAKTVGGAVSGAWNWIKGRFAGGTNNAPAGWAVVGEKGTELVQFGGGERIYPADQTAAILSAGSGAVAGLSAGGMGGMATIINKLEAIVKIDEYEIGRAAYRTVDRFAT